MPSEALVEAWAGDEGDAYTLRNEPTVATAQARKTLWACIFVHMPRPRTVLEVGANIGQNLVAIGALQKEPPVSMTATEPNHNAREALLTKGIRAYSDPAQ